MKREHQKLHFIDGQLFTTLQGVPESSVATINRELDFDPALLAEIVKRFNAYHLLVVLLDEYVEDDANNDMEYSELSQASQELLTELGELE